MATILYLTQIQFEFGAIRLLASECERVGIRRPLIVTDAGVRAAGVLQKALDALPGWPVTVFDQTPPNPTEAAVRAAHAVWEAGQCDGLIAVGGGSTGEEGLDLSLTRPFDLPAEVTVSLRGTVRAGLDARDEWRLRDARAMVKLVKANW